MINWKSIAAILVALGGIPACLHAQGTGTVVGTITDATTGRPLGGAQVVIVDTQLGSLSGADGRYQIRNIPAGTHTVRAILMGYGADDQVVSVASGGTVTADFRMGQTAVEIEGLVVTALGIERQERTVTTSVQQVGGNDLASVPDPNIVASLSGKVAGVSLFNSNTPGGSSRI
ncbi:MAG: carboxypeptidase-like regulatory domain-containing protein, partial [Gemmatimonadota bacterium]